MTASNFLACFTETESFEGAYVDNPHDPGGATLKGVTQAVYTAWLSHHGRPNAAVRGASDADIQAIYRAQYWDAVRGDDLYEGLDLVMVDTGWGSGPRTAIEFLQHELSVTVDGQFGLGTLAALGPHKNSTPLINALCARRMTFFERLPTWKYFGRGWTDRLNGIHAKALEMNRAALAALQKTIPALVDTPDVARQDYDKVAALDQGEPVIAHSSEYEQRVEGVEPQAPPAAFTTHVCSTTATIGANIVKATPVARLDAVKGQLAQITPTAAHEDWLTRLEADAASFFKSKGGSS